MIGRQPRLRDSSRGSASIDTGPNGEKEAKRGRKEGKKREKGGEEREREKEGG
jgi:hypothetical protein